MIHKRKFQTVMYIELNSFFASAEAALHPELRHRPIVIGGDPLQRGCVAGTNPLAAALGVAPGMLMTEAFQLAPYATFLQGSSRTYQLFSREFLAILSRVARSVEPVGLYAAYLDLASTSTPWLESESPARLLQRRINSELEMTASIGIAANKTTAKIAALASRAGSVAAVPYGNEAAYLAPLPVRLLPGIGRRVEYVLASLGITTIGDLARLPERTLVQSFGAAGKTISLLARGLDSRPVHAPDAAFSYSRSKTMAVPTIDTAQLQATLHDHLASLNARLNRGRVRFRKLMLRLRLDNGSWKSKQISLDQPSGELYHHTEMITRLFGTLCTGVSPVSTFTTCVMGITQAHSRTAPLVRSFYRIPEIKTALKQIRSRFGFGDTRRYRQLDLTPFAPSFAGLGG